MKQQTKHIGILWADPYCGNLGVTALAYSTVILFEAIAKQTGLQFQYTFWGASRCQSGILNIGSQDVAIRALRPYRGGDILAFIKSCINNPLRIAMPILALDFIRYDIVADIGAGDSYSDIYGITRFRNINYTKELAHRLHKRYIILPQTLGPFTSHEARIKAKKALAHAEMIFARDNQSYICAKQLLPSQNIEQTIDVAFFLPYQRQKKIHKKKRVGINISGLLWHGGTRRFNLQTDYQRLTYEMLDYLSKQTETEIHLIAHVIGDPNTIDEDTHIIQYLSKKFPNATIAPRFKTPIEAKSYISNMDFFTGARMHACIAALSSGVPVYPIAYSRKFTGLFCDTLGYKHVGDLTNNKQDQIIQGFKEAFVNSTELNKQIDDILQQVIEPQKNKMIQKLSEYFLNHV